MFNKPTELNKKYVRRLSCLERKGCHFIRPNPSLVLASSEAPTFFSRFGGLASASLSIPQHPSASLSMLNPRPSSTLDPQMEPRLNT
jgi:hypothetical protein